MFSAVPFNHSLLRSNPNDLTGSFRLLVPGRATATVGIPQGTVSDPIALDRLVGNCDVTQITVGINAHGKMTIQELSKKAWPKNLHWTRALRLAEDCHNYNVQLKVNKLEPTKLILQCVKPVSGGEELILWFSEEILAEMQIAFLTPANIQGQKRYACTRCSAMYESPNPLKLHITLNCGRQSVSELWEKLIQVKRRKFQPSETSFTFQLTPDCLLQMKKSQDKRPNSQPSNGIHLEDSKIPYRPYSEPPTPRTSAFKPFQKAAKPLFCEPPKSPIYFPFALGQTTYTPTQSYSDEAQIETLMSSLGKSKEGHVCLYCGKCYSRKYGLKIHIRTHTGYKPLKCKFCLRPFGDPSNLNKHVRLHAEGDTPYKCDLCGKVLVRRRDLERHLKSRHITEIHPGRSIVKEATVSEPEVSEDESADTLSVDQ